MLRRIRQAFAPNAQLSTEEDILKAVHFGRYKVKEAIAVVQVRKYRELNKRYSQEEENDLQPSTSTATTESKAELDR